MADDTAGRFPLLGEPLPIDLINTRVGSPSGPSDLLITTDDLAAWLGEQAGRIPVPARPPQEADALAVRDLRDHVHAVVDRARRGEKPPGKALDVLTDVSRAAPAYRTLTWDDELRGATARIGADVPRLLADIADATIDLVTDPAIVTRIRQCEGAGCILLFLPVHPRRRWCSATRCGNRARVARYYHRHKP